MVEGGESRGQPSDHIVSHRSNWNECRRTLRHWKARHNIPLEPHFLAGLKLVVDGARVKGEFLMEFLTWFGEMAWSRKGADEEKVSDPDYIDRKRSVVDQAWNDVLDIILPESDRREPRGRLLHMYIEQRVGRSDRYGNRPPKSTLDAPWGSITTVDRATVKHLVAVGADISYCPVSSKGQTILHWICEQFNYELPPYRPLHEVSVQYSNSD